MSYNGWSSYETWAVNLWLDNDQGTQEYWSERAHEFCNDAEAGEFRTRQQDAVYNLADALKDEVEAGVPDEVNGSMYGDLIGAALSEVDWREIAEGMIDGLEFDWSEAEEVEDVEVLP